MNTARITTIDLLRGIVLVIMALDHVRDFFHHGLLFGADPTDMATTTPVLFLTRFITHYCAPVFVFLAGTSAFLFGRTRSKAQLSRFLWTRGAWMIFTEVVIVSFGWHSIRFSPHHARGLLPSVSSMIALAMLVYLPWRAGSWGLAWSSFSATTCWTMLPCRRTASSGRCSMRCTAAANSSWDPGASSRSPTRCCRGSAPWPWAMLWESSSRPR
ncbi:MAG: DUF1624 domain-containing protein [Flavobacteriales bacterium]|nr:DUF1624 domain-containing protein [Flavobacteriales bacterium]